MGAIREGFLEVVLSEVLGMGYRQGRSKKGAFQAAMAA